MAYCRYCGNELVDGKCSCEEFRKNMGLNDTSTGNNSSSDMSGASYSNNTSGNLNGNSYYNSQANYYQQPGDTYQQPYEKEKKPFLISSFNYNFSSFSSLMTSFRDMSGMSEASSSIEDPYEHNVPIVPDCIEPEENEVVVKQYNLAILRTRLKFMKAEGRMMVTNRRVLFRAAGKSLTGNILQEHQFNLDELAGIEMHKDYKFSLLSFLGCMLLQGLAGWTILNMFKGSGSGFAVMTIALIFGILGLAPTFVVYKHFWLKLFCAMVGSGCFMIAYVASDRSVIWAIFSIVSFLVVLINLLVVCFVPNLVVNIKTKGGLGAITIGSQKSMLQRKIGDDYSGFMEVMPWDDTIMAMNEIGTMIEDLQKHGDYAIAKWSK